MHHTSVKLETPIEFINVTPINPLISKVQIKVCYVSDKPNRNGSVITKEVATEMANTLPGSPIVGFYNEATGDFEEHNRVINISNGKFEIKDTTRPYGFVDLNAKVWFQKFLDDNYYEREYLMTEGYLWTGQYPEAQRVIDEGNNQSMELSEKFLDASWSKVGNGDTEFFIINEAVISKLCILGEDCEPCFEGANITAPKIEFSLGDSFKEQLFSMMKELTEFLKEGGSQMSTENIVNTEEVVEEVVEVENEAETVEVETEEQVETEQLTTEENEEQVEEEVEEQQEEEAATYSLDEIPEYVQLQADYNDLQARFAALEETNATLAQQNSELVEFKLAAERKDKKAMIASFYMLSDDDKKEVSENLDKYSLEEIESKLSVICVRNRVSFSLEEETPVEQPTTYNLNSSSFDDDAIPAWVKAVKSVENNKK